MQLTLKLAFSCRLTNVLWCRYVFIRILFESILSLMARRDRWNKYTLQNALSLSDELVLVPTREQFTKEMENNYIMKGRFE